jgi:hypothetical protein
MKMQHRLAAGAVAWLAVCSTALAEEANPPAAAPKTEGEKLKERLSDKASDQQRVMMPCRWSAGDLRSARTVAHRNGRERQAADAIRQRSPCRTALPRVALRHLGADRLDMA